MAKSLRQNAFFEIGADNELVVTSPKLFDKDLNFKFQVPKGFRASIQMPNLSREEWEEKIVRAGESGEIRKELADKILTAIKRLPELAPGQEVINSYSSGKDSCATTILSVMVFPRERIKAFFCDTGDEWPETYNFLKIFMKWVGLECKTLDSVGIHKLLREQKPFWPMMKRRHCTKDLKLIPQRDELDREGYDQVRKDKKPASFRTSLGGEAYEVKRPAPLMLSGERHSEGEGRSDIPIEPTRDDTIMRVTARPVLEFTIIDVWEFLFWMKAPYNPVYHVIKRVACAGCPFASTDEMFTLGEHHEELLMRWVNTEKQISHPRPGSKTAAAVYEELMKRGTLGTKGLQNEVA